MTLTELIASFPAQKSIADRVLLICPCCFHRLKNLSIHECRVFMLVVKGCIELKVANRVTRINAECFIDLLVWEPVEFTYLSDDLQAWCLLPNYIFTNESLNGLKPADSESFKDRYTVPVLPLEPHETEILQRQLKLMRDALADTDHVYRTEMCQTYFRSFLLEGGNILHHKNRIPENTDEVETRCDTILRSFLKLVWKYYKVQHNVDFYADRLCLSSKHLSRVVRDKLGKTPYAVLRDELLQQALTLLKDSKMPVQEITAELHFSEMATFCKFFKKHCGVSPTTFRATERVRHVR